METSDSNREVWVGTNRVIVKVDMCGTHEEDDFVHDENVSSFMTAMIIRVWLDFKI